jgi:hypothetical protein
MSGWLRATLLLALLVAPCVACSGDEYDDDEELPAPPYRYPSLHPRPHLPHKL